MKAGYSGKLVPGARVLIRDEEWVVRLAQVTETGGQAVRVRGTSELVRGKEAIFLSDLDEIHVLLPEKTKLVADTSPKYVHSRLYLESLLRRSPPTGDAITVGHTAAIDPNDYQLQPAAKALRQARPRILFADGVGLGKTIEVGILLAELIQRGRGDRILVIALKSILAQFQEELWARFTIPLVRLDSVGIQRVQSKIPSNMNPFYFYDRAIISIDTLKRDVKYRRYLEDCHWDVIVIDECQNVAVRGKGNQSESQRARLAKLLARTSDALILTSATPHDGKAESFASLMNLLEPTAVADESDYTRDEVEQFFIRRFKKDISHEVEGAFSERELHPHQVPASEPENLAFESLSEIEFQTIARSRKSTGVLFRTTLLKAFLSSPKACSSTIENRLAHKHLQDLSDPAVKADHTVLTELKQRVDAITPTHFQKYQKLLAVLREIGLDKRGCDERVVIFSERIDTIEFLEEQLRKELGLKADQIEMFHGTLDDQKQKKLVQSFGTANSPVRILLASDAASEGINLHYFCHRLVHFDLPWSLITLEQRNGRVDRFGQTKQPQLHYLLTVPSDEGLQGDLRVLDRLIEKEDMAQKNLGDTAWLMGLHDSEKEEERIARGIEEHESPESIIPEKPVHTDLLEMLLGDDSTSEPAPDRQPPMTLFPDDLAYAREALTEILKDEPDAAEWHDHLQGLTLQAPDDLRRRFDYLPPELTRDKFQFKLTTDRDRVKQALADARQDETRWPEWQLFWRLHPIAQWIDDRVLASFERHQAPVIRVPKGLGPHERIVLFQAVLSNRQSQPALVEWFGVGFEGPRRGRLLPFDELALDTGIRAQITNPGTALDPDLQIDLESLLPDAVARANDHMKRVREQRAESLGGAQRSLMHRLGSWKAQREERLQAELAKEGLAPIRVKNLERELQEMQKLYQQRLEWVGSLLTNPDPYLRVAAVLIPTEA